MEKVPNVQQLRYQTKGRETVPMQFANDLSRVLNEYAGKVDRLNGQELDKAREEGRREALETLHLKLNDCTDIMAKIEKIIDHLNSQSQPEENEEWEKRFIRTFGYWGEEIKFIKQLLKEREREVRKLSDKYKEGEKELNY